MNRYVIAQRMHIVKNLKQIPTIIILLYAYTRELMIIIQ